MVLFLGMWLLMLVFWAVMMLLVMVSFALWLMMFIDCIQRNFPDPNQKLLWVVILLVAGVLGALIYYLMIKRPATLVARAPAYVDPTPPAG